MRTQLPVSPDGTSLINLGALTAFMVLHLAVVWHYVLRKRWRNLLAHLLAPPVGFAILAYAAVNANVAAKRLALVWVGIGVVVLIGLYTAGRRPQLSGLDVEVGERL